MTYPKPIKKLFHKYWRGDKHIYGFYYKQWYMRNIAKPLGLKSYRHYIGKKRRKNKRYQRSIYGNKLRNLYKYKKILLQYSDSCGICKIKFQQGEVITVDHIKPKSKYPELVYDINNMQLAHKECNELKSNE